jgi:hypothetical protein
MTGFIKHYDPPVEFHKAMPGSKNIIIWKRVDDAHDGVPEVRLAKPKNPTKPKSRLARPDDDDDEMTRKADTMTNEIDRGPFAKMLDRRIIRAGICENIYRPE